MNKYIELFMKDNDLVVNEVFKIKNNDKDCFYIDSLGDLVRGVGNYTDLANNTLLRLFKGDIEVEKLPFNPKEGDDFWTIHPDGTIAQYTFHPSNGFISYFSREHRILFRSGEEAEKNKERVLHRVYRKVARS